MTKICIVGPSKKFLSGISYYTIRLANSLAEDYSVSVVCFRNLLPKFMFPGSRHVGKDLASLDYSDNVSVFNGMDYNNPLTWYRAYKFLKKERPDIVILQWWTSSVAHMHLLISLISSAIGAKVIIEFHEVVDPLEESILPIRIYSRFMGRLLVRRAALYVTHSESDKKLVVSKYHIPEEKVQVIPHGLYDQYRHVPQAEARKKLGLDGEYVILTFGLIRPYKGIPNLIKAFGDLPAEMASRSRLLIAGEIWEDREAVTQAIASSPYRDRITLVDSYIPDDAIPLYFNSADVVALPYLRASQSGVAHIAMAFGKPIVVSRVGGLEESMADYAGTRFVPPGDTAAISDALMRLYAEKPGPYEPPKRGWDSVGEKYGAVISMLR
ncbi:MAG TPA: glycosyltransferase [Methanocella sp.]|uniref:glycosyltransferase n=1 Tax=Methanocella sp. TaxID=2052833 RepID=UPI002CC40776|nr:glycosyltransferase [Methanocella sp.]HTY91612.1 glycosyltransferase [Methanocella sp.]